MIVNRKKKSGFHWRICINFQLLRITFKCSHKKTKWLGKPQEFLKSGVFIQHLIFVYLGECWRLTIKLLLCDVPIHQNQFYCLHCNQYLWETKECCLLASKWLKYKPALGASQIQADIPWHILHSSSHHALRSIVVEEFCSQWQLSPHKTVNLSLQEPFGHLIVQNEV